MTRTFTDYEKKLFWFYFNVADEIYESLSGPIVTKPFPPLTLADIDAKWVQAARLAADKFGLSWPPYLPEAEEYSLEHYKEL